MHKVIVCLVIAFVLLGLALIMLSKQLEQPVTAPHQSREMQHPSSIPSSIKLPELPELKAGIQDQKKQAVIQSPASILPPLPESLQAPEEPKPTAHPEVLSGTVQQQEPDQPKSESKAESKPAPKIAKLDTKAKAERPKSPARRESANPTLPIKNSHILVYSRNKGATVRISASDDIHYKQMIFSQPDRVVIDLIGVWDVKTAGIPKNVIVSNIRIGHFPKKTRIVLDLPTTPRQTKFILSQDHRQLDVRVDK